MASNPSICGICSLRQITKICKYWCPGCEEGICDECQEHHKLLKATRSHEPIPISNYKSLPSFITGIQQSCVYHNEQYQQYCAEHALPICFKCINDHRKCNVTTLAKVTNDFKTSEQFLDLESRLDDLLQNIGRIKKDRNSNMTNIEEMKMRLRKEIRQKRVEINKHFDNLEKQLIKDLEEKECQSKDSIQKVLSSVTEKETMITQCHTNFQSIKQYASDLQTFLGIKEIEVVVYENEQYLQSLIEAKSLEHIDLEWKVDPVFETIPNSLKNFGSIKMRTKTSSLEFISSKNNQAQIQVVITKKTNINDVKLILQTDISTNGRRVKGCCMSKEGDFLFTDHFFRKSLITIASNNKLKHTMALGPSYGFDITLIDETTVAITDGKSGLNFGIDIIDIKNQRKIKFIRLPGRTWGITRDDNSMFVCVEGRGIYKTNYLDGTTNRVISCYLPTSSYVSVFLDKIYYTNCNDHSVVCCDKNGSRVWTFQDELILNEPRGIAVDKNGNVYVVEFQSSSVIIISSDGKHHKQILTTDNGLFMLSAIFLDTENRKLLVANTEKTAFVYNIS